MALSIFSSVCATVPVQIQCAPCYTVIGSQAVEYPTAVEATTIELIPLATILPNGSTWTTDTITKTHGITSSSPKPDNTLDFTVTAAHDLTWIWSGLTLTYPTKYYYFDYIGYAPAQTAPNITTRDARTTTVATFTGLSLDPVGCTEPTFSTLSISASLTAFLYTVPVVSREWVEPTGVPSNIISLLQQPSIKSQLGADITSCEKPKRTDVYDCPGGISTCTYAGVSRVDCTQTSTSSCQATNVTLLWPTLTGICAMLTSTVPVVIHPTASILTTITGPAQLARTIAEALPLQTSVNVKTTSSVITWATSISSGLDHADSLATISPEPMLLSVSAAPSTGTANKDRQDNQGTPTLNRASSLESPLPAPSPPSSNSDLPHPDDRSLSVATPPETLPASVLASPTPRVTPPPLVQATALPLRPITIVQSGSTILVGSQTLALGSVITVNSQLVSRISNALVIGTTALTLSAPKMTITPFLPVTMSGSMLLVAGTAVPPGSAVIINGETVSVDTVGGSIYLNGSPQATLTDATATDNLGPYIIGGLQPGFTTSSRVAYTGGASRKYSAVLLWLGTMSLSIVYWLS